MITTTRNPHRAIPFGAPAWERIRREAEAVRAREAELVAEQALQNWNPDKLVLQIAGEEVYGYLTGQQRKTDEFFDGGEDFPGVDVKAVPYWDRPLLCRHVDMPARAPYFALIAIDLKGRRGRYVGWATRSELLAGEIVDWGFGPTRILHEHELHKDGFP